MIPEKETIARMAKAIGETRVSENGEVTQFRYIVIGGLTARGVEVNAAVRDAAAMIRLAAEAAWREGHGYMP